MRIDPQVLLTGPRGRRLLLEYALASACQFSSDPLAESFPANVLDAAYHLDPDRGAGRVVFGSGRQCKPPDPVTADDVAALLTDLVLVEPTEQLLREALAQSVDAARYWQEPEGEDHLAAAPIMRPQLRRMAEMIVASPHTSWWSIPPAHVPSSTRMLSDGNPAGLWFAEDHPGLEYARTEPFQPPRNARVVEVDSPLVWAELCRRFPVNVTAQKRHDWYRATGRNGRWVIPDWAEVAEHYDGVHLQVVAYLAGAGAPIPVDGDTATVLAGWNPDETYWFTNS